jgi:uncharacterized membrane protein
MQQRTVFGWTGVAIAAIFMVLVSGLILYPKPTAENILAALRFSSVTTALPFLLVFAVQPLVKVSRDFGEWIQSNRKYLWIVLTFSHLLHLYQIFLFYQLGQSCPVTVWAVTAPLWIFMVLFSGWELMKPEFFEPIDREATTQEFRLKTNKSINLIYGIGIWYIWLVFTLAFGLSAVAKHIPFYNIPALVLFLSAAIARGMGKWRRENAL